MFSSWLIVGLMCLGWIVENGGSGVLDSRGLLVGVGLEVMGFFSVVN